MSCYQTPPELAIKLCHTDTKAIAQTRANFEIALKYLGVKIQLNRKSVVRIAGVRGYPGTVDYNPYVAMRLKFDLLAVCGWRLPYKKLKDFIADIAVDSRPRLCN
jgi:hypothetical protein